MNCTLVDLCKTSKSVNDIIAIQLTAYMGFLTNVLKLDENTIVALLFRNRSSVIINKRDFHVFVLDDIHIYLHSSPSLKPSYPLPFPYLFPFMVYTDLL